MPNHQNVTIMGHLGKDPEFKEFESGGKKVSFSVAVSETWRSKDGEKQEHTEWFNVVAWSKGKYDIATWLMRDLAKGFPVFVSGTLRTREYEQGGETKRFTELNARDVQALKRKPKEESPVPGFDKVEPDNDDDLPF